MELVQAPGHVQNMKLTDPKAKRKMEQERKRKEMEM